MNDPVENQLPPIATIILAAGRSSRMGSLKPLLPFGDSTVLGHVVSTVATAAVGPAYVVVGNEAAEVTPRAEATGAVAVENPAFDAGMMSSIKAGLAALPDDVQGAMILPVDVPLVRAETLRRIAESAWKANATVLRPSFRGRLGHPPFVGRALFAEIIAAPPETTLRDILESHRDDARTLAVIDSGITRDMDFPDEYRRLAEALTGRRHPDEAECEAMLDAVGTPDPTRRHCEAVARVAVDIAARLRAEGLAVDVEAVRAGALLHDIAKGEADHAVAGARHVAGFGFADVAGIVASHMQMSYEAGQPIDERHLVFLADKLVRGDRLVGLDERFAAAFGAFAANPEAIASVRRRKACVAAVLATVEARIGPVLGGADRLAPAEAPP